MPNFAMFQQLRRDATRAEERRRGEAPSLLRLSSGRAASSQVENVRMLPCVESSETLQDASGAFFFLAGYSHPSGPDLSPGGGVTGDSSAITGDTSAHTGDEG